MSSASFSGLKLPHAPLFMPAVSLAAGIACGPCPLPFWPSMAALSFLIALTIFLHRYSIIQWGCTLVCFAMLGLLISPGGKQQVTDGIWTDAVVVSSPVQKSHTIMAQLLFTSTGEQRRCYLWNKSDSSRIEVGQGLRLSLSRRYFASRSHWQLNDSVTTGASPLLRLRIRAMRWRAAVVERLTSYDTGSDAQAVVAAMTVGDKSGLSRSLRQAYATAGTSHVLALSGLHLGIIYTILTTLTLRRKRFWLGQLSVVLAIWAFALITGLNPSVLRAATMITVYSLFSLGGRDHSPLGVLSFTALVMMLVSPGVLFDVGFQLSFTSMMGILLFMPLFEDLIPWLQWSVWPLRFVGGLIAVSVAAQLGTAPLVAYHFGQLPLWFFLSNIIVVPLATLLLYAAVLTLIVPQAGFLLMWIANFLNAVNMWLAQLPMASIANLHPSPLQVVLLYVAIAALWTLIKFSVPCDNHPASFR
ncbi:MAG: ComEC/Rec2 family competence protein [Prevotella sp.]|nr:ComEC/Rec2 family competence protein [Prevotella sp.]